MAKKKKAKAKKKESDPEVIFEYSTDPKDYLAVEDAYRLIFDAYHSGDKKEKRS